MKYLPNPENITPFVKSNKWNEGAVAKCIFTVLNQVKCYERFNYKKEL